MAHTKFRVEVLTPEGEVFNDQHDDLPESAFLLKGTIDDVVAAAKGE